MNRFLPFPKERGIALLAMMVLLMVVTAVIMVNRAGRIASSSAADTSERQRLSDWMNELKYANVMHAITEDNTPGALPCPDEKPSCAASATALAGKPPSLSNLELPDSSPSSACIQYSLAPSLRNFLTNDIRGIKAQQKINPDFVADLIFTDANGVSARPWAVLIAGTSGAAGCSLAGLGYSLSYDSTNGTARVSPASTPGSAKSLVMTMEKKDVIRGLLAGVLQSVDGPAFRSYLNSYFETHPAGPALLSGIRAADPVSFDTALLPAGTLLVIGSDCSGTTNASSSGGSSPSVTYKNPVSWLCFNTWHNFIRFDPIATSFSVSDSETGTSCMRKNGATTCAN